MKNYTQISYEERVIIADLWRKRKSYYYIAKWLGRKYDTIQSEVERNGNYNKYGILKYHAKKAEQAYLEKRLHSKESKRIIENNYKIGDRVKGLIIEQQLSPEQIAHRYDTISRQTIYN